jgi:hypothetical protein
MVDQQFEPEVRGAPGHCALDEKRKKERRCARPWHRFLDEKRRARILQRPVLRRRRHRRRARRFKPLIFMSPGDWKRSIDVIDASIVQQWFREVAKGRRLGVPSLDACHEIGLRLNDDWLGELGGGGPPKIHEFIDASGRKGARAYIKSLERTRLKIQSLRSPGSPPWRLDPSIMQAIADIDLLIRDVKATLVSSSMLGGTWHGYALWIANLAIDAWKKTGKAPRAPDPEGPLCQFVKLALGCLGYAASEEAISDALRGRRGRGRAKRQRSPLRK